MKKGFTLIELLVVVLIIGILAAVALPQYEKAVAKSRAAEALTVLNTLRQQMELSYMATGDFYPNGFEGFDVTVPGRIYTGGNCPEWWCSETKNWLYALDGAEATAYPLYGGNSGVDSEWSLWASPMGAYVGESREGKTLCLDNASGGVNCKKIGFTKSGEYSYQWLLP